jgi:hypothetical protein
MFVNVLSVPILCTDKVSSKYVYIILLCLVSCNCGFGVVVSYNVSVFYHVFPDNIFRGR